LDTGFIKFRFTYTKKRGTVVLDDVLVNYHVNVPYVLTGYDNTLIETTYKKITGLNSATAYYYRVRAETKDNSTVNSNVIVATTKNPSGAISDVDSSDLRHKLNNSLVLNTQVFPNPSSSEFALTIQTNKDERFQVLVTGADGKEIYHTSGTENNKYIFGKNFGAGMYFVTVTSITFNKTIKIIKGVTN